MFATALLDTLLRTCAPNIGMRTMTAIVRVESDGNPLAIHDNTIDRSFSPVDVVEALAWTKQLVTLGHSVDLGLAQINNANLPRLGYGLRDAFDPCKNLRGGATILQADYRTAAEKFGPGQFALRRALGAYNTGSLYAGDAYIARILSAAGLSAESDFAVPDLAPIGTVASSPLRPAPVAVPVAVRPRALPALRARVLAHPVVASATAGAAVSPILVTVEHIDPTARARAIAASAGASASPAPSEANGPVVLKRSTAADGWTPPAPNGPIVVTRAAP